MTNNNVTSARREHIKSKLISGYVPVSGMATVFATKPIPGSGIDSLFDFQIFLLKRDMNDSDSVDESISIGGELLKAYIEQHGNEAAFSFMVLAYKTIFSAAIENMKIPLVDGLTQEESENLFLKGFWMFVSYVNDTQKGAQVVETFSDIYLFFVPRFEDAKDKPAE